MKVNSIRSGGHTDLTNRRRKPPIYKKPNSKSEFYKLLMESIREDQK